MKIFNIQSSDNKTFKGKRLDKNAVSQLMKNNPYSLTEPNQRYISNAIENLGKVAGEKNIQFLLDAVAQNKYSTSITLQDLPKNDWKTKLLAAATAALTITPLANTALSDRIAELKEPAQISQEESEILNLREQLLAVVDFFQINKHSLSTAKNLTKNLDYFITSSETSLEHKKYVLERLNYFMSDEYGINPQLSDKKTLVLAEMINDMAIHTPGNEIPNIKAVNQKQHGMCAAISIVRKKLAYEDKPNYVDAILSELDSSDTMMVYDRSKLGSGEKVAVQKVPVDFDAAIAKGYRVIDASTMHWMQIAGMSGSNNISYSVYNPFDREHFDVKNDSFFMANFENEELAATQKYYQSLIKAKSVLEDYKASKIVNNIRDTEIRQNSATNLERLGKLNSEAKSILSNIAPKLGAKEIQSLYSEILNLKKDYSSKINSNDKYSYIPNEEAKIKFMKMKKFIIDKTQVKNIDKESLKNLYIIINEYQELTKSQPKPSAVRKASTLYDIAAAFRYQMVTGLDDKKCLENSMKAEGLPNKETSILNTIDTLIEKLENNSVHSELILEQLHKNAFDKTNGSKDEIINALKQLKHILSYQLTESLDDIYEALMLGNRKEFLSTYIENSQQLVEKGQNGTLKAFSEMLGVKKSPKNVLRALEADKQKLLLPNNEREYSRLFDKYLGTSQLEYINNIFQNLIEQFKEGNNEELIANFLIANQLTAEDGAEAISDRINVIASNLEMLNKFVNKVSESLRIVDKNGDILISANPKDIIIKKLENEHQIASAKQLRELQSHLDKIAKIRSTDEFQSRQGKIKDKSLLEFSKSEKETLKEVEKSIDPMMSFVHKQLNYVRTDMKDYLEEIARLAGVNDGSYWVGEEGNSGLYTGQQIRVLEYMTGRPHYSTKDIKSAIEQIKTSPYSGISSSSVYHNKAGGHAQYIADITPVRLKNGEVKDVLFNDNSWGASEKENTWVDSNGLTRTDYSDNRGGTLGYITNDSFRNGNFVDRILSDMILKITPNKVDNKGYKRIRPSDREDYSAPQYSGIILDGKSPEAKNVSDSIHDALFVTNDRYIDKFKKLGEKHTEAELQAMITDYLGSGKNWKPMYEVLKNRIFTQGNNKISSKEAYDKLADTDYLKVVLEKIALKQNAQITGLESDIAKVRNVRDLSKFRAVQKTRALNSFKYAFSKTYATIDYLADSFGDEEFIEMQAILDKHNIKLTDDELNSIGEEFSFDKDRFDGSAKTTLTLLLENIREDINKVISDANVQQELEDFFRKFLSENLYFNKNDLDMSDFDNRKISHIVKFIDRVFDPADDEEFVEIYNRIQDMTEEEFNKEILAKASYEDMGVKTVTGYDILKKIQRYEESANTSLMNTVYYDSLVTEIDSPKYEPNYKFGKFSRTPLATTDYKFNRMFRDLNYDLSLLTLPKLFNKYKGRNLKNYGAYPAYPILDYTSEDFLQTSFDANVNSVEEKINTIRTMQQQIKNYEIAHLLKKLKKSAKQDMIINSNNYVNLNNLMGTLIEMNANDSSMEEVSAAAETILEFEEGQSWKSYLPYINSIIKNLTDFEKTTPKEVLEEVIKSNKDEVDAYKKAFVEAFINPKYKSRVAESYNQFERVLISQKVDKTEFFKEKLMDDFRKYHILNEPQELLIQFIKSCAKDSSLNSFNDVFEKQLQRAINYAKLAEIQEIVMDAISDGVALNAKTLFNKHKLTMSNGEFLMGSDEMISYMTLSLILGNDFETALVFLEKLGLNEKFVKHTAENIDYEALENIIKEASSIASNFKDFQEDLDNEFAYIQAMFDKNSSFDYKNILGNLRIKITDIAKKYSINQNAVDAILFGIDTVIYNYDNNPNAPKDVLFVTIMTSAKQRAANEITEELSEKDSVLGSNATVVNFVNQVMLPANSEADNQRTIMNERFKKLAELKDSLIDLQEEENSDNI